MSLRRRPRTSLLLSTTVAAGALVLNACGGDDQSVDDANVTDVELTPASEGSADEPADAPADGASDRPDVTPPTDLPSELVITDIIDGTGPVVQAGDTVWVDYTGIRSEDGVEFDNSYDRGEPFRFTVGQGSVIDGWDQGLIGASAGTQRRLDIPAELAYGDQSPGGVIRAGDALTFVIEVRAVVGSSTAADAPDVALTPAETVTELVVDDAIVGDGAALAIGDTAIVHLRMARADNLVQLIDTWGDNNALLIEMVDGFTVPGLFEGLQGMNVGGVRVLTIPAELAFGSDGAPSVGLPADTPVTIIAQLVGRL
ncbi:MAG: FKBP-type peptidyl-prolyl cis-trans isomerase [Actinomycetota bacterium]|nr:FKBP-type peptidyl-prolyl cis-trans isomerase [Actinomycetota bacterium]MDA3007032.1 FKBP-type peptidyl-prolyl cis-trans isomerase [Actinomycetota bacterium]MDA3035117.1 FKBP-type peptidyl-prolyl cis-trans isomerase [Actinomycetota bacterium]